jgi:hypothetical protein
MSGGQVFSFEASGRTPSLSMNHAAAAKGRAERFLQNAAVR